MRKEKEKCCTILGHKSYPAKILLLDCRAVVILVILLTFTPITQQTTYQAPNSILNTSQYHFIPNGSYLQYTFTSANIQIQNSNNQNDTFSEFSINFQVQISQSNVTYNILVFPQGSDQSQSLFQCYVKAAIQGLKKLMCPILNNSTQNCVQCYQNALYSQRPTACLNCQQKNYNISLSSLQWQRLNIWNNTVVTIFDNSPVVYPTGGYFEMILSYDVSVSYNEQYQALFYLFVAVVSAIIVILIIGVSFVIITINKVQKNIQQYKTKVKDE